MYQLPRVKDFQKIYENLMKQNIAIVPPKLSHKFGTHPKISYLRPRGEKNPPIFIAYDRRSGQSNITLNINKAVKIKKKKNYFYIDFEW